MNSSFVTPWWQAQPSSAASALTSMRDSRVAFGALVAFTAILLLSPQTWFPPLKVLRLAFLAAGIAACAHFVERMVHRRPVASFAPEVGIALTLVGWSLLTLPLSVWPGGSVRVLTDHYLKAVGFFLLLGMIVTTTGRLRTLMWTLTICSVPLAATAIANFLAGDVVSTGVRGFYRIVGYSGALTENPNDLALMLNLIIPLTGALAVISGGPARILAMGAMLLSAVAVVLTFSRAGFLTLAAIVVLFLVVLVRRITPGIAAVLLLVVMSVPLVVPEGYFTRMGTITNIKQDVTGSAQGRWRDTKVAAGLVAKHPLVGAGIGQDILVMNTERGIDTWRRVHNAYLQYGVDLGVPGLLLFVWLHLTCFRTARAVARGAGADASLRDLQPLASGVQISLAAFTVAAMFHPIAYQFYFFSVAGLAVALRHTYLSARRMPSPANEPGTRNQPEPGTRNPEPETAR